MADFVFNIAKGRVAELASRVDSNDPANSALVVVPINRGTATDVALRDLATLSAVLGVGSGLAERTTGGWNRKVLTDADLAAVTPDNTNDRQEASLPVLTWATVATGNDVTDLLVCYDADTTAGTDANLVPLTMHAFPITTDGSNVQANAGVFFRAS
jgi:hypothetical protein